MEKILKNRKGFGRSFFAVLLVAALLVGLSPTFSLPTAAANGVQQKLDMIRSVYPTGSYFTSHGGAHNTWSSACPDDCYVCHINGIPARGGLPSGASMGYNGWQCWAFASYVGNILFGSHFYSWSQVSAANAKVGDIIAFGNAHYAVYLGQDSNNWYVYDANWSNPPVCNVRYWGTISKGWGGHAVTIYHANNYDAVNGSSTPSVTYTSITPGNYYLRNKATGKCLSVSYGTDANQQNIDTWDYSIGTWSEELVITVTSDGYKMRPLCSSSRLVNAWGDSPSSGSNVNLYDDMNDSTQWWKFEQVNGGYIVHNSYIPSCVLDLKEGWDVIISTRTGGDSQIWELIPAEHTCNKGEFVYFWKDHPHYNCYKCSICGTIWHDTSEPTKLESCEECYPKVHTCNYSKFLQYQTAHPHYAEYQCPDCGKTKTDTSKTTKMESCKTCYPPAPPSEKNTYYFEETYNKDGTISVLIGIDTAGVVAVQGSVAFNREDLELVSYKDSGSFDSFSGPQTIDVANQDGVMYYFASSATKTNNLTGKIPVFTAVFRPKKDTETTLSGAVESASDTDLNQVSFAVSEKTFPTVDPSPKIVRGDVNGDGEVNAIDGAVLSRYLAKWKVEINQANADINGDGEVNSADGALLSRHLAKWNIEYFN